MLQIDNTKLAIITITILEIIALFKGIDGALLSTVVAILSGLGGYEYAKRKK